MKRFKRKTLSLLLLVGMLFSMVQSGSVSSFAASSDFTIVNGVLTKFNGSSDSVTIPSSVKTIGTYAFNECTDITKITIPNSVITIEKYAFEQCSGITKITIPDSVTSIGDFAFEKCTELKSVVISKNVKAIGIKTFSECSSLTKVTIPNGVTSIGKNAFDQCSSLSDLIVPATVKTIGRDAFLDCDKLTISGYKGSAIETYAKKNDIPFKSIGIGTLTVDTKSYAILPRGSYSIGVKLTGTGLSLKATSSKSNVVKVVKVSGSEYKVTGLKVGSSDITFNVYDRKNKLLAHDTVKIVVQRGVKPHGITNKQTISF